MKKLILLLFILSGLGCKKTEDFPKLNPVPLDFKELTYTELDNDRLCIAEVLSKMLLDEKFREFVKLKSIDEEHNWNNEIHLLEYWNKPIIDGKTLFDLLSAYSDRSDPLIPKMSDPLIPKMSDPPIPEV